MSGIADAKLDELEESVDAAIDASFEGRRSAYDHPGVAHIAAEDVLRLITAYRESQAEVERLRTEIKGLKLALEYASG